MLTGKVSLPGAVTIEAILGVVSGETAILTLHKVTAMNGLA